MSKNDTNNFKALLRRAETDREFRIKKINKIYPPYDDYWYRNLHYTYNPYVKGFKRPKKQIWKRKVREYRTWKYNRKTQWR